MNLLIRLLFDPTPKNRLLRSTLFLLILACATVFAGGPGEFMELVRQIGAQMQAESRLLLDHWRRCTSAKEAWASAPPDQAAGSITACSQP